MRAELPWNVAGIPPEAREAARAAARREGLSVGEWLTRRILRSFSGMEEDAMPVERASYGGGTGLDPWGLPQSSASRRDTEEMLARVSRSESESSDSYRRIEEQLRGVARRLDSSERSQSENNRVLSKTAAEINVATREQAQAVDQLSNHLMMLSERLERVERNAAQDGLKDAVKGLHQGLSRLADQITQTATQSGNQVSMLAGNMEQLAARLDQVRADVDRGDNGLEQRLMAVEKSAHFNTNALDHTLEKIEAQAGQRAGDMVEAQRRAGQTEESLIRLEEAVARLDMRGTDPATLQRMDGIERNLSDVLARLPAGHQVAESVMALTARLDLLEKNHREILDELRSRPLEPVRAEPALRAPEPPRFQEPVLAPPAPVAEAPPFAEPAPLATEPPPYETDFAASHFDEAGEGSDPFAPVSEFMDPFATPETEQANENFLSAARRSARAAAEAAQAEQAGRFARLRFGSAAAGETRSRLVVPAVIALTVIVALAAGIAISARLRNTAPATPAASSGQAPQNETPASLANPPADGNNAQPFVVAPPGHVPAGAPRGIQPLQEKAVRESPVHSVPGSAPQAAAPQQAQGTAVPSLDRVVQLANNGNPVAATVIGLRYLDGNGVAANPAEAFKWLSKAADAGQAVAQYRLGTMYERGQGMTADPAKAAHYYELAANQGNRKAMHNLAVAYASGALGKKNMAEAARWFSKAAGLGLSDSQFNLAVLYERGDGVPQSLLDAFKWYSIAAGQGDSESKQRLTVLQTQLGDADKAAAQKSATSFHAAPLSRSANVPPDLADVPAN